MRTLYLSHPAALAHDMGPGHPESPDRLRAIERVLAREMFAPLKRLLAPRGTREALLRAHVEPYVAAIEAEAPEAELVRIDTDTLMGPGTLEAAMRACGGACEAVDRVMSGDADNAFVAMRPPGHHATRDRAMGFCFFNNAAIAVRHAQVVHGVERVAIVDFDVHHGNGTQDIFWADASIFYGSTHEMPLYPGSGGTSERGEFDQVVNAPLRAGDGGEAFRTAFTSAILPRLNAFSPDLVIVSAGFDAHRLDPLAGLNLVEADFAWVTGKIMEVANRHAKGRIVSLLEGGYDLQGLSLSVAAHVATLMGH